jgi:hypothetical protein
VKFPGPTRPEGQVGAPFTRPEILLTKVDFTDSLLRSENIFMILTLAAIFYGYLQLELCHRAEASYRTIVDHRLKVVCG